jgi:Flp pilus assembly secretin CpaC
MRIAAAPKPNPEPSLDQLLIRFLTRIIAPDSWTDQGGKGTIQYNTLGMTLQIGQQPPDIHEQVVDLLNALRRLQDVEVVIEARVVLVPKAVLQSIGMDLSTTVFPADKPWQEYGGFQFRPTCDLGYWAWMPANRFTPDVPISMQVPYFNIVTAPCSCPTWPKAADVKVELAFFNDLQRFLFLQAVRHDVRTAISETPPITLFNGQTADIDVGDDLDCFNAHELELQRGVGCNVTVAVTPVVSGDRRFVRLKLDPSVQVLGQERTISMALAKDVILPDGGTVIIGGLKTQTERRSAPQDADRLANEVGDDDEARILMVIVTARIIINEEVQQEFPGKQVRIPR